MRWSRSPPRIVPPAGRCDSIRTCVHSLHAAGNASQQTWIAINGNLAVTKINSVAYHTLNAIVFSGHQDTGSAQQTSEEGTVWQHTTVGYGTEQGADNSGANSTVRFTTIRLFTNW